METKITRKNIQEFFDSLPKNEILDYAKKIQKLIRDGNETTVAKKEDGTLVTEADTKIEQMIVDCFNKSQLKGLCDIRGEEGVANTINTGRWTLVVDPIDGSSSLVKGKETWGVMVGFVDDGGVLRYSWNFVSSGDVFQTATNEKPTGVLESLSEKTECEIDFYDYKSGQESLFTELLVKNGIKNVRISSSPSAVWAGWLLSVEKLSALVWVIGENEKKTYPDYDLLFLAPLMEMGYSVRLGKLENNDTGIVVVAPTNKDADDLYLISLEIMRMKSQVKVNEVKNILTI